MLAPHQKENELELRDDEWRSTSAVPPDARGSCPAAGICVQHQAVAEKHRPEDGGRPGSVEYECLEERETVRCNTRVAEGG